MEWLSDPEIWIGLATLSAMEVVLGIDNVVFISILAEKLPERQQSLARRVGLALAIFAVTTVAYWRFLGRAFPVEPDSRPR